MNHHFAASWLKSLSNKLDTLVEWTFASGTKDACTGHRNLFREFFSLQFQKTLALVDETKRTQFLGDIERNLYKFEAHSQQFPLSCLCALLHHGKDSPQTQQKISAWVDFLLGRLREPTSLALAVPGGKDVVAAEVMDVVLSCNFQKFIPLMNEALTDRLADGIGERLCKLDEEVQKKVMDAIPAVPHRIEAVVAACTDELNVWLESAPRFPATPAALVDTLAKMEHPLVRFFTAVKDTNKKESFLVAVALSLQSVRTRFRWMCWVGPELEGVGAELRNRLFYVEGQGAVMEMWLQSRLKKYNTEVITRAYSLMASDYARKDQLRARLQARFPERQAHDPDSGWVDLDGPTRIADTVLDWLRESLGTSFFLPTACAGP